MIAALVKKDITLYFHNQFFALVTGLSVFLFIGLYFLLPDNVDQSLPLAVYFERTAGVDDMPEMVPLEDASLFNAGLELKTFDSREALIKAVEDGDYAAGLVLPADATTAFADGNPTVLDIYLQPGIAPELRDSFTTMLSSSMNNVMPVADSNAPQIARSIEVLGPETDAPIPVRNRMMPALLLAIFFVEMIGLATLITEEIEHGTAQAILTTPMGIKEFFISKAIMGMGLAFGQVFLIVLLTGALFEAPLIIVISLLIGSLMITGIAFMVASVAKEMMSVMAWSMIGLVVLAMPSITIIFPAIASDWVKIIPSYYLADTLHQAINYDATWSTVAGNLVILLAVGFVSLMLGSMALRRRFQ